MTTATTWSFEDAKQDELPEGWSTAKTGDGPGSVWKVLVDSQAQSGSHVMAQTSSQGPKALFNLAVLDEETHGDVDLTVSVRAVSGDIDRGGGPMWRYRDANNYYICRWNPLEDNFRVYHVVAGKRTQMATVDLKIDQNKWHTIRVIHAGSRIRCFLDDTLHLEVRDEMIQRAGKVGLWTKADAVTHFDDLKIKPPEAN